MGELIVLAVVCVLAILFLAGALVAVVREHRIERETWKRERERMLTAVLSRSASEFAMSEAKMNHEPVPREPREYHEPAVGL